MPWDCATAIAAEPATLTEAMTTSAAYLPLASSTLQVRLRKTLGGCGRDGLRRAALSGPPLVADLVEAAALWPARPPASSPTQGVKVVND